MPRRNPLEIPKFTTGTVATCIAAIAAILAGDNAAARLSREVGQNPRERARYERALKNLKGAQSDG